MTKQKKDHKKRGCIGNIIVLILGAGALVGLAAMGLCLLSTHINPQRFAWIAIFGLAFWGILIYNLLVFVLLLCLHSRGAWITALALLMAIPGFAKSFAFGRQEKSDDALKVMTYNLHMFQHIDGETSPADLESGVVELVKAYDPDVLCCQEFSSFLSGVSRPKCIERFQEDVGFRYAYYNMKRNYGGNVIFSKYPLTMVPEDSGFGAENTYGTMAHVDAGEKGRFCVACVHLLSYQITNDEIDILIDSQQHQDMIETMGRSVLRKLKVGFERRSDEIDKVLLALPKVDVPVIICGDFNEVPVSYVYSEMKKAGFVDNFVKVGHGISPTYAGKLPLLRIDYIWSTPDVMPLKIKRIRHEASDHYPVILEFSINNKNNIL